MEGDTSQSSTSWCEWGRVCDCCVAVVGLVVVGLCFVKLSASKSKVGVM